MHVHRLSSALCLSWIVFQVSLSLTDTEVTYTYIFIYNYYPAKMKALREQWICLSLLLIPVHSITPDTQSECSVTLLITWKHREWDGCATDKAQNTCLGNSNNHQPLVCIREDGQDRVKSGEKISLGRWLEYDDTSPTASTLDGEGNTIHCWPSESDFNEATVSSKYATWIWAATCALKNEEKGLSLKPLKILGMIRKGFLRWAD